MGNDNIPGLWFCMLPHFFSRFDEKSLPIFHEQPILNKGLLYPIADVIAPLIIVHSHCWCKKSAQGLAQSFLI